MFHFFRLWFGALVRCFHPSKALLLENLALRQQLSLLKRRHPKPKLWMFESGACCRVHRAEKPAVDCAALLDLKLPSSPYTLSRS